MATFSRQYDELLTDIISNGVTNKGLDVRTYWKDGEKAYTKALWGRSFLIQPQEGFPILSKKFVNPISYSSEILWIMQKASNNVQDARDLGTNVWNEWENEEGTIGKAYGYQIENNTYKVQYDNISDRAKVAIGKEFSKGSKEEIDRNLYKVYVEKGKRYVDLNQIDYVIHQLIDNPYSRQTITTLMNPKEFHEMALPPCVWATHWEIMGDNRLYLSVKARSSDTFLGLPFNVSQYAQIHRLIAHIVGVEIGDFFFTMDDVHIYDRHIPIAMEYQKQDERELPEFWIDKNVKSFQEFEYGKNFGLNGYTKDKHLVLRAPIAIGKAELERIKREENKKKM